MSSVAQSGLRCHSGSSASLISRSAKYLVLLLRGPPRLAFGRGNCQRLSATRSATDSRCHRGTPASFLAGIWAYFFELDGIEHREYTDPVLPVVATKAPDAEICLISVLAFHGITTQIPRGVPLAAPRGKYSGLRLHTPPVKTYRFDESAVGKGFEEHEIDHVTARVYGVAP